MSKNKIFIGVRLEPEQIARLDALTQGEHGIKAPRSEVIRLAIAKGLEVLERSSKRKSK